VSSIESVIDGGCFIGGHWVERIESRISEFIGLPCLTVASGTDALTLALMVLPILIRAIEAGFRSASEELRLGGAALGFRRTTILRHLLLPAAAHGIVVGLVLGVGRALAETAALIFTSGYVTRMPSSLMDSGRSLSVHIYDLAMNVPGGEANAYSTAVVLIFLLIMINSLASWATETWLGGTSLP